MVNHFWESVDIILEEVPMTLPIVWCLNINLNTIIFQCSKIYGNPTRATRLKFAPNMTIPISPNEKELYPKGFLNLRAKIDSHMFKSFVNIEWMAELKLKPQISIRTQSQGKVHIYRSFVYAKIITSYLKFIVFHLGHLC